MTFKTVLRSLQEVFPQVDCRILKAVAIEHSKDVDAAVEFVLLEVLPALSEPAESLNPLNNTQETESSSAEVDIQDSSLENQGAKEESASQFGTSPVVEDDKSNSLPHDQIAKDASTSLSPGSIHLEYISTPIDAGYPVEQATSVEYISKTFQASDENNTGHLHDIWESFIQSEPCENVTEISTSTHKPPSVEDKKLLIDLEEPLSKGLSQPEATPNLIWSGSPSDKVDQRCLCVSEDEYPKGISENGSQMVDLETDASAASEKPLLEATQSGHAVRMNMLEEFITIAKSNKETLVAAFELICNMMKDVEVQEDRAKLAKEEASKAGHDILTRVEDMKHMLAHAKGANEMRAGEIFGEKAVLAAEAGELQSRLLNLSDEKEKYLSIVQEIQGTLEARLAAAIQGQHAAHQEKLEREEEAQKILNEQKVIMDEVTRESKRLEQEAEENAKLRKFLVHKGGIVDILQGELAVICEDVLQLKERVDGYVPSNKSPALTSSLASPSCSSSNHGSFSNINLLSEELGEGPNASGKVHAHVDVKKGEKLFSDDNFSNINLFFEELEEGPRASGKIDAYVDVKKGEKLFSDDEWEMF